MIEFVRRKIFVSDALLFLLLLIVPDQQKKLTTTAADPLNLTQCVLQNNDRGLNFGCSDINGSMIWVRLGFYGLVSSNEFCNDSSPSASDCIPDPTGDRRNIASKCNTFTTCQVYGKTYSDIIALCTANKGGFPYARVSYECLSRKQADGNDINTISSYDQSSIYSDYYGKVYFMTSGYPYDLINKNVRFRVTVNGNTKVSIRLLDAYGRLLNATGSCAFTLYIYSALTSTYREWCVNSTSWTVDDSIPVVFPASQQVSQDIDIVFTKTNPNLNAEGAFWMLIDAVNVVDNSPGRGITVYCGSSFTPQVQPTTITQTSTTTTTPTTTTPTTTTSTTTTPTITTPTTTTSATTTLTTTTTTATTITPRTTPTTTTTQATESVVWMPSMTSSPTMSTSAEGADDVNSTNAVMASQNTSLIIGVVVAVAGVIIIIIIVVAAVVTWRRNLDRKSKPRGSVIGLIGVDRPIIASYSSDAVEASKSSSTLHSGENIYDEIHDPSVAVTTHSYPPQQHHPASPTILRIDGGQLGASSNVSDDDEVNRQTAQNADEVHPRIGNIFTPSFVSRQDSVPSPVGDSEMAANTRVTNINPIYGYPQDIYIHVLEPPE